MSQSITATAETTSADDHRERAAFAEQSASAGVLHIIQESKESQNDLTADAYGRAWWRWVEFDDATVAAANRTSSSSCSLPNTDSSNIEGNTARAAGTKAPPDDLLRLPLYHVTDNKLAAFLQWHCRKYRDENGRSYRWASVAQTLSGVVKLWLTQKDVFRAVMR